MRSRTGRALLLGLAVILGTAFLLRDRLQFVIEDRHAAQIKAERLLQFGLGLPLPGTPDVDQLETRLTAQGFVLGAPAFLRIFKAESELELWLRRDGRYERFATYPVCRWSGRLGPKLAQGDRQAPEGFYSVAADQLNPNSRWHRSFNIGFPNVFDRSFGRTGTFLMVHGGCSSAGCYAMTDPVIDEIWRIVTAALGEGQPRFHVHIFPFRMTTKNMAAHGRSSWSPFWLDLKQGYDLFEAEHMPPRVMACQGRYVFERLAAGQPDPSPLALACLDGSAPEVPRASAKRPVATPTVSVRAAKLAGGISGKTRHR